MWPMANSDFLRQLVTWIQEMGLFKEQIKMSSQNNVLRRLKTTRHRLTLSEATD